MIPAEDLLDPRFDIKAAIDREIATRVRRLIELERREDERKILYGDPDRPDHRLLGILVSR
jgi:hypothetical protein